MLRTPRSPRRVLLLAAFALSSLLASPLARADDTGRTALDIKKGPPSAPPPNWFLFWSGVVAFGFAYNDSIFVAIQSDRSADHRLFIPVVGPWLDLGQRDCSSQPCHDEGVSTALLIIDGVAQGVGAVMIAASFLVRDQTVTIRMGKVDVAPAWLSKDAYGMVASGRF